MEEFNIWDLERVHIKLAPAFIKKIKTKLNSKFKSQKDIYNKIKNRDTISFLTFRNMLKENHLNSFFVPLRIYLNLAEITGIKKEELQKNILAYKTAKGINYIEKTILPIKITPIFDMLLAHHIADGTVINPKKGRLPYFGYRQFDKFYRLAYIKKIEEIFGKIKFKENYFEKSTRPYCPPVLSTLFFKYYHLKPNDFLSDRARIPKSVFKKGKENIFAVLIAFIIDEGNIDSTQIVIHLINKNLIDDLKKICVILRYESTITCGKIETHNYYRLNILREGMKKLYSDYLIMTEKYPVIDLGWKGEKIKNSFKIDERKIFKTKGNAELILNFLKEEPLSVNQLAERILMTRQGVRFHIHNLLKANKIEIIDDTKLNWIYRTKC